MIFFQEHVSQSLQEKGSTFSTLFLLLPKNYVQHKPRPWYSDQNITTVIHFRDENILNAYVQHLVFSTLTSGS